MKRILLALTFLLITPQAPAAPAMEIAQKLNRTYSENHFTQINDQIARMNEESKDIKEIEDFINKNNTAIVNDLGEAVDSLKKVWDQKLAVELVRVSNLLQQNDPSDAVGSILLPLYESKKKDLLAVIRKLPQKQAAEIEKSIQREIKMRKSGNG